MSEKYQKMMKQYPLLFHQKNLPMTETCMCWGIQAGEGWYEPLNKLCSTLEELNKNYSKYRIRIEAEQVKEKYGELRFYHVVRILPSFYKRILAFPFYCIREYFRKHVKFNWENKIIKPSYTTTEWEEITKEEFNNKKVGVSYRKKGNQYFISQKVTYPAQIEKVLKDKKFLWKFYSFCHSTYYKIIEQKPSEKQKKISKIIDELVFSLIHKCEQECWNCCEICGSKKDLITTSGWISRICSKCSQKQIQSRLKELDENNKQSYKPRIYEFIEGYEFLSPYHIEFFKYKDQYYSSFIEAYYCNKDEEHKDVYKLLAQNRNQASLYLMEVLAKQYFNVIPNDKDKTLIEDIIKSKLEKIDKERLKPLKNYDISYRNEYHDNIFGYCSCDQCKKRKHNDLYAKALIKCIKKIS